jgi:hypothetical protein
MTIHLPFQQVEHYSNNMKVIFELISLRDLCGTICPTNARIDP